MGQIAEEYILSLKPYVAGRAIGNNMSIKFWAKLASNENCFGPSPMGIEAAKNALAKSHLYPNAMYAEVIRKICHHHKDYSLKQDQVVLGSGSNELIINLVRGLVGPNESLLYGWPSFNMYQVAACAQNRRDIAVPLLADLNYDLETMLLEARKKSGSVKLIFLPNPNNPTGQLVDKFRLKSFAYSLPEDVVLVIDEAYFEYVIDDEYETALELALSRRRTVILRTFSKVYGLAGMRLGYAMGDKDVIDVLGRIRDPFNINLLAQYAAIAALDDKEHVSKSVRHNLEYLPRLALGLRELGFIVSYRAGNFVFATLAPHMPDMSTISEKLFERGVIIRPLDSYELRNSFRVTVGTEEEIALLFDSLKAILWL